MIYTNRSTMFAVPFDLAAREMHGSPVPIVNDIAYDPAAAVPQYDICNDGTLVYRSNSALRSETSSLMAVMPTATGPDPRAEHTIIFVQNFFDELRRRVPMSR